MLRVESAEFVPFKLTCVGDHVHVVLDGNPVQESETLPVKSNTGATATVVVSVCPRATVREFGDAETVKPSTFCVKAVDELPWKFVFVEVNVAVIVWLPAPSELVESCALPLESVEVCTGVVLPSR